jgi:hypothetical protein
MSNDHDDLAKRAEEAWKEVMEHPAAGLPRYLSSHHNVDLKLDTETDKINIKVCPLCQGKGCAVLMKQPSGHYAFQCRHASCSSGDTAIGVAKFIQHTRGCDWKQARAILHELTGIPDPYAGKDYPAPKKPKKPILVALPDPETAQEPEEQSPAPPPAPQAFVDNRIQAPEFITLPDPKQHTIYEAAWTLMTLSPEHMMEIQAKRGMSPAWVEALGFRTATANNARTLAPLLEQFPPNDLLRSGIAQRDPHNRALRISDTLCGREYNEEINRWQNKDNIIIPYVNGAGRITLLRPHKRSLSNSRWREREAVSEFYEKLHNNLRQVYGEHFIENRPTEWAKTVVICEGEMKAAALRQCGIPAIAFQGIHFFLQNKEFKKAIDGTAELLRNLGVREVIVVFDNEDKGHKEPHLRFEAEVYARYTAECMEDSGFQAWFGMLPDEWRENGKADWDSRLAHLVRTTGSFAAGLARATAEFTKLLNDRPRKGAKPGTVFAIHHVVRQVEFFDFKEDVINQALHKLRHVPKIFTGTKHDLDLATEIQNFCHEKYTDKLRVPVLIDAMRATQGGYYKTKAPSEKMQDTCNAVLDEVKELIRRLEANIGRDDAQDLELRKLRAAEAAAYAILYRYPKPFTDFTAESLYKVLVTEADGSLRQDRLIEFRDKNGKRSRPCQLSSKMMRSAQELRSFFLSMGHYHWMGGQEECDLWGQDIDVKNYQRLIEEIDTYGWNKEGKFYLLGDCAVLGGGRFIFPDKNGIIWVHGTGYKNSDNMAGFTSKPPILFPHAQNSKAAKEEFEAMDWDKEREEVEAIWTDMLADYKESFGGYAGFAVVAGLIQYLAHAEVRTEIGGKPGLWVQGEKGSGKTKSIEFAMRAIGYPLNYGYISLGGTKVGVERSLCQFSNLPFHIDEWRNENADPKLEDLLRNCYNETATPKGTPNGGKAVRKLVPSTIPIVTGEDGSSDAALRSRYVRLIASQSYDTTSTGDESDTALAKSNLSDQRKRDLRYYRIMERSEMYFRIGRYLFKHRDEFAASVVQLTKGFGANARVMDRIKDSRARQVFGTFYASLLTAQNLFSGKAEAFGKTINTALLEWFVAHGAESAEETERDVFRRLFFAECVTMIERGVQGIDKYIRVRRGTLDANGRLQLISQINDTDGRLYVLIASSELFAEYKADKSKRRENAPIAQHNILAELRTQSAWVPAPKNDKARQHRYNIPGEKNSKRCWWILDYKRLDPELKPIFQKIWERELATVNMEVGDDGESLAYIPKEE